MRWTGRVVSAILFCSLAHRPTAAAAELAFSRNSRTFETQQSSLVIKGMAHACLTVEQIPDSLPCNPAFTPMTKTSRLNAEALLSNGYANIEKMRRLLDGEINQAMVDALFGEERIIQIEANAEIDFLSQYLNARYTPITIKYFSVVRNEANPEVDLYAVQEENFAFQTGHRLAGNLYGGLQIRRVSRKFIRRQFFLLDLATEQGKNAIKPKTQNAAYFEPGLAYIFQTPWKIRLAAFVANLGLVSEEHPELPLSPEAQFGIGVSPPVGWGELEFTLDYRSLSFDEQPDEKFRFGSMYRFGAMYLTGGLDYNGVSGGVFYGLQQVNAGILYSTTAVPWNDNDYVAQTVYVQIGWQI